MDDTMTRLLFLTAWALCSVWVMFGLIVAILFRQELRWTVKMFLAKKAKAKTKPEEAEEKEAPEK